MANYITELNTTTQRYARAKREKVGANDPYKPYKVASFIYNGYTFALWDIDTIQIGNVFIPVTDAPGWAHYLTEGMIYANGGAGALFASLSEYYNYSDYYDGWLDQFIKFYGARREKELAY